MPGLNDRGPNSQIYFFCLLVRIWTVLKTFEGPCFGCDCGIKCCELLLKQLCPKFEIAECLFKRS